MKRLEFLDGLRGIAALYVIVLHVPLIVSPGFPIPGWIKPFVTYGWSGVELFFVISGFSLTMTMPSHDKYDQPMVSYAISRLSRIAPLYYVLILGNVATAWLLYGGVLYGATYSFDRIVKSALFVFNLFPETAGGVVGASWTIGVEMLFYVAFPLVYQLAKDVWRALAMAILAVIASSLFFHFYTYRGSIGFASFRELSVVTHFPTFVLGIAAYLALQNISAYRYRERVGHFLTALGIAGISWLMANPYGFPLLHPAQSPGLFYALMIVGLGLAPWPIVANRIMQFYGRICYSVYLWHPPVIFTLEPLLQQIRAFGYNSTVTLFVCYAVVLAAVTAVATVSHNLIEIPGLWLGQHLKKPIGAARSVPRANLNPAG